MNTRSTFRNLVAFLALAGVTCAPQGEPTGPVMNPGMNPAANPDVPFGFPGEENAPPPPSQPIPPLRPQHQPVAQPEIDKVLQRRVDDAIDQVRRREVYTNYGFWTVFHAILGLGPDEAYLADQKDPQTGGKIKALDYICNGGDMLGLKFVEYPDRTVDVITRSGDGFFQGHQDQFIAELTQWGVKEDRVFKVNGHNHPFKDFIAASEKRIDFSKEQELSWAVLIIGQFRGMNYGRPPGEDQMSLVEKLAQYEILKPIGKTTACGGTHRLFDLTWVYFKHRAEGGKKEGVWKDVAAYLENYRDLAKKFRNPGDGTFSNNFFLEKGTSPNPNDVIRTTGHTFEWLSLYLTDEELREPWMQDAANALSMVIINNSRVPLDGGSVYHAVHGLQIYRARVFGTKDMPYPPVVLTPPKD